ncbi:MAG TPA: DUF3617 family protein [Burkholderiaceae bacterium]|nr:DUF3617 family protein [Burkholderiaceae bacterium]HQR71209.1 DUF3617 family protein [Burkholderiaceae bacterium]
MKLPWRSAIAVCAVVAGSGAALAQAKGEEWEYAMTMEMAGMKMPMPPTRVCARPDEGNAPVVDKNCQLKDVKTSGSTTSFRIICGPPEPSEGSGRYTRKGDRVEGRYTLKSADGEMAFTSDGRKVGACDPSKPMLSGAKK